MIRRALCGALLLAGCSGSTPSGLSGSGASTDAGTTPTPVTESDAGGPVVVGPGSEVDGGVTPPRVISEVFGQSGNTLFRLDPTTKALTTVGVFSGCGDRVIDIALDKNSKLYGTTYSSLVAIDRTTAVCTIIANGTYPNSLSFVPAGTVDATSEALVGYQGSTYVRINPTSGAVTTIGTLGGGYTSSGDIVSVIGGATYLTAKGGPNGGCNDCLLEVNPATGALVKNWGSVDHSSVFGLAFWAGTVYGFTDAGKLFSVEFDRTTLRITDLAIPNAPSSLSFFGAGSTTSAPIDIPR